MVLDINYFRDSKLLQLLRESETRRCETNSVVDAVIEADEEWKKAMYAYEQLKKGINEASKNISEYTKKNKGADLSSDPTFKELREKAEEKKKGLPDLQKRIDDSTDKRNELLKLVGNIVDKDTVQSKDESLNRVLRKWHGEHAEVPKPPAQRILQHHEILTKINGLECNKGVEIAGHRGFFLKGAGCLLNLALIQYGMQFLVRKGYLPVHPPYFMKKEVLGECAELLDFEETLYAVGGQEKHDAHTHQTDSKDRLFLIATSEQPLAALHRNEVYQAKQLPIKYAGVSSCFRKEAGAHGKDLKGIFRIHQFQKVEQFIVTTAENSVAIHEEMMRHSEEFYQSLGIPYRVVSIVAGALNKAAAKKYDLEAWFPGYGDYRELVSCSNCTDYQARALNARYFTGDTANKTFLHMLNGTLVASQRCLCCVLENYQTDHGVVVPKVLVPFMDGVDFIPYSA
ncbi:seryl-tRNA synthetase, putative [Theileria equi strain WA]|uniref:serine--tRNA ligase n=1 Tax=Theileria equi strain WA TaxID=1537102 RepID=L1LCQ6_THEEQ|nr:seryl-tRNA synthetase, putative [Theileria equi strain WA]EKX73030.1 seryl-tRNA synthetase, putative [Theileria equi strain WA]|eukprot:XP_004832482.1 seryl-tRNA synthetase, putative [Theileria equi strain WA]